MKKKIKTSDDLYNSEQKKEYIAYESKNSDILLVYFKKIKTMEEKHKKDICDMDKNELKNTLISLNIPREDTRNQMLSLFRGYISWVELKGKTTNRSAIYEITAESLRSNDVTAKTMLKSPEQVEEILKEATNIENINGLGKAGGYYKQFNRANKDRLVFWLLYCGLTIYDLQIIKKSDINYDGKFVIDRNGVKHDIYDPVIPLWQSYSKALVLEKAGTNSAKKDIIENEVLDSEFLFRPVTLGNQVKTHEYSHFSVIVKKILSNYKEITNKELKLLPEAIKTSGIFYRLYLEEKQGLEVSYSVLAEKLGKVYENNKKLALQIRKWKIDYDNWKIAFGYM